MPDDPATTRDPRPAFIEAAVWHGTLEGADTGFYEKNHQPEPEFESALYGAAGVAHHEELTRPLVETGKLTPDSLATMLLR
ncbi:MAG: hypothetical protein ACRD8O_01590, partial [Bryobacteraceae bacterium]